jgi:hypothetical protein
VSRDPASRFRLCERPRPAGQVVETTRVDQFRHLLRQSPFGQSHLRQDYCRALLGQVSGIGSLVVVSRVGVGNQ